MPVAWAPAFWLRSPGRVGLLPPDLAWRGADGFFAGGGVHVPWRQGDRCAGSTCAPALTSTAAPPSTARCGRRRPRPTSGGTTCGAARASAIAAHGATAIANGDRADSVAWDVDALRGARAVSGHDGPGRRGQPFDRATAQAAWRVDGWTLGSQIRAVALRGERRCSTAGVAGAGHRGRRADALGNAGAYDATVEGGR